MLRRSLLAAPLVVAAASKARADWVPRQPIHVIVGFAPGGTADIAARIAGEAIQRRTGTTVVVDSKTRRTGLHRAESRRELGARRLHRGHRHHGLARRGACRAGLA